MSEYGKFYDWESLKPYADEIVETYKEAFKGYPWFEESKCPDAEQRCEGGFSPLEIGRKCATCGLCPEKPAYEKDELIEKFDFIDQTRPTQWYIEKNGKGISIATLVWQANTDIVANERYTDVPDMQDWLESEFGAGEFVWLDETFANKKIKPEGDLRNFGRMCLQFSEMFNLDTIAFRTKSERLIEATRRDFTEDAYILDSFKKEVPDRRDFIVINPRGREIR